MVKQQLKIKYAGAILFFAVSLCFLLINSAGAAILYLENSQEDYYLNDSFFTYVWLNTQGENINTIHVDLSYSSDNLDVEDISYGDSILSLWIKAPEVIKNEGKISLSGGVPGGYYGDKGLLAKVVFKTKQSGNAKIYFERTSQALLNDGLGTITDTEVKGVNFNISDQEIKDEGLWSKEAAADEIPPEPFEIEIEGNESVFNSKYFVIFSTIDKQTGVDYYEIKEAGADWQRATSPYLLKDQSLTKEIAVKAVDKAGNERLVVLPPRRAEFPYLKTILIAVTALITLAVIYFIFRKLSKDKQ